jgi:nucleoside-diphosphate-sugar epimerase
MQSEWQHTLEPGNGMPGRIVVMGAAGFVGGAIARNLLEAGADVVALTRRDIDLLGADAAARLAAILTPQDVFVAVSADAPCRAAAQLQNNLTIAQAIADALALQPPAHVINISSDAIYADGPRPLSETTPTAPTSLHGIMHLMREAVLNTTVSGPFISIRPSLLYGAADPHNGYGPNRFMRQAAAGEPILLFGEGEERRDHVFIDDLAEIVRLVIIHGTTGVLNVATGLTSAFHEVASRVAGLFPEPPVIRRVPRTGAMPHGGYRPFDIVACHKAFPQFRFTPLDEGLTRMYALMQEAT